jgi:GTP-dependent phosphoenolpyruvate carboxykinase
MGLDSLYLEKWMPTFNNIDGDGLDLTKDEFDESMNKTLEKWKQEFLGHRDLRNTPGFIPVPIE